MGELKVLDLDIIIKKIQELDSNSPPYRSYVFISSPTVIVLPTLTLDVVPGCTWTYFAALETTRFQ